MIDGEAENAVATNDLVRDLLVNPRAMIEPGHPKDDVMYAMALAEIEMIEQSRRCLPEFAESVGASPRWVDLMRRLAGLPVRATPGSPSEES